MTQQPNTCLKCGSSRIVIGTIESRGPIEKRAMFHANESKTFKLSLKEPYVPIPCDGARFCADCGLCWNSISDLENALSILQSWGTETLNESLQEDQ